MKVYNFHLERSVSVKPWDVFEFNGEQLPFFSDSNGNLYLTTTTLASLFPGFYGGKHGVPDFISQFGMVGDLVMMEYDDIDKATDFKNWLIGIFMAPWENRGRPVLNKNILKRNAKLFTSACGIEDKYARFVFDDDYPLCAFFDTEEVS
jgi:hypothetical protein